MMVVAMMVVVPGFGRGLRCGAADQQGRGDDSERGARAGNPARKQVLLNHLALFPLSSIATFCGQWTPVRF